MNRQVGRGSHPSSRHYIHASAPCASHPRRRATRAARSASRSSSVQSSQCRMRGHGGRARTGARRIGERDDDRRASDRRRTAAHSWTVDARHEWRPATHRGRDSHGRARGRRRRHDVAHRRCGDRRHRDGRSAPWAECGCAVWLRCAEWSDRRDDQARTARMERPPARRERGVARRWELRRALSPSIRGRSGHRQLPSRAREGWCLRARTGGPVATHRRRRAAPDRCRCARVVRRRAWNGAAGCAALTYPAARIGNLLRRCAVAALDAPQRDAAHRQVARAHGPRELRRRSHRRLEVRRGHRWTERPVRWADAGRLLRQVGDVAARHRDGRAPRSPDDGNRRRGPADAATHPAGCGVTGPRG